MNIKNVITIATMTLTLICANSAHSKTISGIGLGSGYTITCSWSNGDHWSITTNSVDRLLELDQRCTNEKNTEGELGTSHINF